MHAWSAQAIVAAVGTELPEVRAWVAHGGMYAGIPGHSVLNRFGLVPVICAHRESRYEKLV